MSVLDRASVAGLMRLRSLGPVVMLACGVLAGCPGPARGVVKPGGATGTGTSASTGTATTLFPFRQGAQWIWNVDLRWTEGDGDQAQERQEKLTWTTHVVDVTAHGPSVVAHVRGLPGDLAWYNPGTTQPADTLLVLAPAGSGTGYYEVRADAKLLARAKDPADALADILTGDNLIFRYPMQQGEVFCAPDQPPIDGGRYCWRVEATQPAHATVKGGTAAPGAEAYDLAYRTNPDHTMLTFVPGLGIVSFAWAHHGTTYEVDATLAELR
jgi:hypothetical protein